MSNNLTVAAKSAAWTRTPDNSQTGRRTALNSGFFMSAARLCLPVMVGWVELPSGRSAFRLCADSAKLHLTDHPIEIRTSIWWSLKKHIRRLTMAQLRLLVDDRLSVYAKRVRNAIKQLPVFGGSPRILLDEQEISELSKISVDKVRVAIDELQREGYIAPFYNGRKSKCSVYALQNPSLSGDVMEVWV